MVDYNKKSNTIQNTIENRRIEGSDQQMDLEDLNATKSVRSIDINHGHHFSTHSHHDRFPKPVFSSNTNRIYDANTTNDHINLGHEVQEESNDEQQSYAKVHAGHMHHHYHDRHNYQQEDHQNNYYGVCSDDDVMKTNSMENTPREKRTHHSLKSNYSTLELEAIMNSPIGTIGPSPPKRTALDPVEMRDGDTFFLSRTSKCNVFSPLSNDERSQDTNNTFS